MRHLLVPMVGSSPRGSVVVGRTRLQTPLLAEGLGELARAVVELGAGAVADSRNIGCVVELQWTSQLPSGLSTALAVLALASAVVKKEISDVAEGEGGLLRGELGEESGGEVR